MTPRMPRPFDLTSTAREARPCVSPHRCVVDFVGTHVERSRTLSDGAGSCPQPLIEAIAGQASLLCATSCQSLLALQSP